MATLTIRNFPDDVRDALRVRAAERGRSMEGEARRMLTVMLGKECESSPDERIAAMQASVRELLGGVVPSRGVDRFLAEKRLAAERGE